MLKNVEKPLENEMRGRVAVAMSGGVDSSVAAALLWQSGFDIFGITMWIGRFPADESITESAGCGSSEEVRQAKAVCERLGIPHVAVDMRETFRREIVEPFVEEYRNGRTPSPCVNCNIRMKFGHLWEAACRHGARSIATGHYARLIRDDAVGKFRLYRGVDRGKDQSYFLGGLTHPATGHVRFPLGEYRKSEIREMASRFGFESAEKKESQDVCFIAGDSYVDLFPDAFVQDLKEPGDVVDPSGRILGKHEGYYRYTIGQRRGLGVAGAKRSYVVSIDPKRNRVVLGPREMLRSRQMRVDGLNLVVEEALADGVEVSCQIRSRHRAAEATLFGFDSELKTGASVGVHFKEAQEAITPGQLAVFYRGEEVLGSGWIAGAGPWKN